MANESHSPSSSDHAVSAALLGAPTNDPPQDESSTKGMLRDVIHKVMEEIEHHEREAKKHTQKAAELRRELRESFAFVQEAKKSDARPGKADESKVEGQGEGYARRRQGTKSRRKEEAGGGEVPVDTCETMPLAPLYARPAGHSDCCPRRLRARDVGKLRDVNRVQDIPDDVHDPAYRPH